MHLRLVEIDEVSEEPVIDSKTHRFSRPSSPTRSLSLLWMRRGSTTETREGECNFSFFFFLQSFFVFKKNSFSLYSGN